MKAHTTLTIEQHILEKAKEMGINMSALLEGAITSKSYPNKKDLPDNCLGIRCTLCKHEIQEGYLCREREMVLCNICQQTFKMLNCPHDKDGHHLHIKFPGNHEENIEHVNEAIRISQNEKGG